MDTRPDLDGREPHEGNGSAAVLLTEEGGWTRPLQDNAAVGSELLKSMAHEARLSILCLLSEQERSVTELEVAVNLRQPAVSQQLARLRSDRLVTTRRDGKMIFYSLASQEVRQILQAMCACYANRGRAQPA
ncbi:metalloregulator ArsR/SmtB family transcription factor [Telmatospirillum sp.]|uniref:ArsR/SmtB family transcription factor n=1 Tax=Telmatospirillum sp. TaxID=2079197 RepID=UPI0028505834|nr:metalloregulator ArsR/SmtB family transcription factor [Telmatospirillum sp.]MDR3436202.1 metalloregulator ArsR/SmtB family transcription factor [Telmatospirillum sp.]